MFFLTVSISLRLHDDCAAVVELLRLLEMDRYGGLSRDRGTLMVVSREVAL